MRIAYLGFDQSSFKTFTYLSAGGNDVVYFLKQKNQNHHFSNFDKTDIYSNKLMIPFDIRQRTNAHKHEFSDLEENYNILKQKISTNIKTEKALTITSDKKVNALDLSDVIDIQHDANQKKIVIELEKSGAEIFDILLTEAHPLVTAFFETRKIQIFKARPAVENTWTAVNFEYEFLKPILATFKKAPFFTVLDPSRASIIDNWLYCNFLNNNLQIWSFQPTNQLHNPEFQDFYIDRLRLAVAKVFPFLHLNSFVSSQFSSIVPFQFIPSLKMNLGLTVPNFDYWSEVQIAEFFQKYMLKINKKVKKIPEASL